MAKKSSADDLFNIDSSDASALQDPGPQRDVGAIVKSFIALALIGLFTVFAIQNAESVDVEFITWEFSVPLILLLIGSVVVGTALFELMSWVRRRRNA